MMTLGSRLWPRAAPVLSEARPADAAAFAALHAASFRHGWNADEFERLLLDRTVVAHRAMAGGNLAGFIISRIADDEAEILSVAVAIAARGRGLAGKLLDLHMRRLAGLGAARVFLEVGKDNAPACRLYAAAGFEEVGRREGYYQAAAETGSTALVLRRDLA